MVGNGFTSTLVQPIKATEFDEILRSAETMSNAHRRSIAPDAFFAMLRSTTPPKPEKVIFNPPATVVYWNDGTKTVVSCNNDEFSEEFGYAMACMRKLYGSRAKFKECFKDALRPYLKKKKKEKDSAFTDLKDKAQAAEKIINSTI